MRLADFPTIEALSEEEKLTFIADLWLSIGNPVDDAGVSDAEKEALDDRWAQYLRDPSSAMTGDEFKARMNLARAR